jgi:hypothetical protein
VGRNVDSTKRKLRRLAKTVGLTVEGPYADRTYSLWDGSSRNFELPKEAREFSSSNKKIGVKPGPQPPPGRCERPGPMRENAEAKGRRYLTEGWLVIETMSAREIRAICRGQGENHRLGYSPGGWYCCCPALGRCAHLVALMLVRTRPVHQLRAVSA